MTSILFVLVRIYCDQFKCHYLKNKTFFLKFLLQFSNPHENLNILKKEMSLKAYVFPKFEIVRDVYSLMFKRPVSENPSTVNL